MGYNISPGGEFYPCSQIMRKASVYYFQKREYEQVLSFWGSFRFSRADLIYLYSFFFFSSTLEVSLIDCRKENKTMQLNLWGIRIKGK